ncbi:hypothetical protein GW17_00005602 [Ensete ventricosum]|nr:hypothetical protein GW17_00005602 [Ensete ventricosum]
MYNVYIAEKAGRPRRSPPRPPRPGSGISAGTSDPAPASAPRPLWLFRSVSIIYCFVKQKPEEGSISHRVQRLAKYRFLKVSGHKDHCTRLTTSLMVLTAVYWFLCALTLQFFPFNLQKQSELLLNADDLDAMWVRLRGNCVIDDATGAEKVEIHVFPEQ